MVPKLLPNVIFRKMKKKIWEGQWEYRKVKKKKTTKCTQTEGKKIKKKKRSVF